MTSYFEDGGRNVMISRCRLPTLLHMAIAKEVGVPLRIMAFIDYEKHKDYGNSAKAFNFRYTSRYSFCG